MSTHCGICFGQGHKEKSCKMKVKPMKDECNCGAGFRTGEDYRDHLPCSAIGKLSSEEEELIKKHRQQKEFDAWEPLQAKDISNEIKCELFDALHKYALEAYDYAKTNGYERKDCEYYAFEEIMNLLGDADKVWPHYRKFLQGKK